MSVHVIGDEDTVLGLRLVGASGTVAADPDEARRALDAALDDEKIDLLLLTRKVFQPMQQRVNRLRTTSLRPVILEIPGKDGAPPEDSLDELIRRAVGISV